MLILQKYIHDWEPWKFTQPPQGYWKDKLIHRKLLDWLGAQLGYKDFSDWYNITYASIRKHTGRMFEYLYENRMSCKWSAYLSFDIFDVFRNYNFSLIQAIMDVYSEHEWEPWNFTHVSQGFWNNTANHSLFLEWLGKKLNFKTRSDWYSIKASDFSQYLALIRSSPKWCTGFLTIF